MQRAIDLFIEGAAVALILLAPLPLGSVAPWARSALFLCASFLLLLWIVKSALAGRIELVRAGGVWALLLAYLILLGFQLLPLPEGVLAWLSPKAAELYGRLIPGYPETSGSMPLSLNPHATTLEIYRVATLFILLFVLVHQVRRRRQVNVLLWSLVGLGLFESLYGLGERFSGNPHIFWVKPPDQISLHGTYYNRNHFAGLMEMLTPAAFGFLMTFLARKRKSFWRSSNLPFIRRVSESLSKARVYRDLLLGLLVATMFVCGALSLSRGGILGLLIGSAILFTFAVRRGGSGHEPEGPKPQRLAVALAAVLLLSLGILFYQGLGSVIDRFEQLTEESSSWSGRAELRQAGLEMIRDFPLLGAGGGTFGDVFPAYQPARYGDKLALYLHNDWLQVVSETGLAGALILYAALAILLLRLLKRIRTRKDNYCRFVFAGSFAGVAAMLVHSLFDFNLYMVAANGVIFVVLLSVCHAAAHMKGLRKDSAESFLYRTIPVPAWPQRALLIGLGAAGFLAVAGQPARTVAANVAFSRYQSWAQGEPDHYYFWRPRVPATADAAKEQLDRASLLMPASPEVAFHQALCRVRHIEEEIQALAREIAAGVLLKDYAFDAQNPVQNLAQQMTRDVTRQEIRIDESSAEFQTLVSAFLLPAKRRLQESILHDLSQAHEHFQEAIRMAPTVPWYHMDAAVAYASLLVSGPDLDHARPRLDKLVRDALSLAPERPSTLYHAGWYSIMRDLHFPPAEKSGEDGSFGQQQAMAGLKKAIEGEPRRYAVPAYTLLLDEAKADPRTLIDLTPETIFSRTRLFRYLQGRRIWPVALDTADQVLRLVGLDPASDEVPPDLAAVPDNFMVAQQYSLARLQLLRRLGSPDLAASEDARYGRLLGVRCLALVQDAGRLARLGRTTEALKGCQDCLRMDWNYLDALLEHAEIVSRPGLDRSGELKAGALDGLMRVLLQNPAATAEQCDRVRRILEALEPGTPPEHLKRQFVDALASRTCGDPGRASQLLEAMLLVKVPTFSFWHQRHLIHYELGECLEALGRTEEAARQYFHALTLAPAHRPALARLAAMGVREPPPEPAVEPGAPPAEQGVAQGPGSETAASAQPAASAADPSAPPSSPPPAPLAFAQVLQGAASPEERLRALTPDAPWEIDFSGKVELLGTTVLAGGGAQQGPGDLSPAVTDGSVPDGTAAAGGFEARYYWTILDDLDAADYEVSYVYLDAGGSPLFVDRRPLQPGREEPSRSLDAGIGTVLLHGHTIPFPPSAAVNVQIQVRSLPKGKLAAQPLLPATGEKRVILGLAP
ncbi:MAG: O-antigen ligase family protein [bacterium]